MVKECKICKLVKDIECFALNKECAGGRAHKCKECFNRIQKEKWHSNKEEVAKQRSERRKKKLEYFREVERVRRKKYREANKDIVNKKYRDYMKEYRKKNPTFCMSKRIANIIKMSLDARRSSNEIFQKLGYTIEDLVLHLESLFKEGMSWDNYGEWHLDHIIPQSWLPFNSIDDENFIKCWSLSNLQPLWAKDNISKSNKYSGSPDSPIAFLCDLNSLQESEQS